MSHQIVLAIDFSEHGERVISEALRIARAMQSHVYCVHIAAPDPEFVGLEVGPAHERSWRAAELREEHRELEQIQARFREEGLECTALLVAGATAEKLLDECQRRKADLLIMGTHGHSRLHDLMIGSTANGVIRRARLPVMLVPLN